MKLEILGAYDRGREFVVSAEREGDRVEGVIPRELLDDEIGVDASEQSRREWIETHAGDLAEALFLKRDGGVVNRRFASVLLKES